LGCAQRRTRFLFFIYRPRRSAPTHVAAALTAATARDGTPAAPFFGFLVQPITFVIQYPFKHVWHCQLLLGTHCAHPLTKHDPAIMQYPFDPTTMPGTHDTHWLALPAAHA
jgi:hypothetical protein